MRTASEGPPEGIVPGRRIHRGELPIQSKHSGHLRRYWLELAESRPRFQGMLQDLAQAIPTESQADSGSAVIEKRATQHESGRCSQRLGLLAHGLFRP